VKKLALLLSFVTLGVGAVAADAATLSLGTLPDGLTPIGAGHNAGGFADTFNFNLSGALSDVVASFASITNIDSFDAFLQEKTPSGWTQIGSSFTSSETFSDLTSGKYRLDVIGFVPSNAGFYSGNLSVAAVPETDTWLMLLIGSGLVGYQLRRKQKTLPQQPFAAG
jgi:hypothetical protein